MEVFPLLLLIFRIGYSMVRWLQKKIRKQNLRPGTLVVVCQVTVGVTVVLVPSENTHPMPLPLPWLSLGLLVPSGGREQFIGRNPFHIPVTTILISPGRVVLFVCCCSWFVFFGFF